MKAQQLVGVSRVSNAVREPEREEDLENRRK